MRWRSKKNTQSLQAGRQLPRVAAATRHIRATHQADPAAIRRDQVIRAVVPATTHQDQRIHRPRPAAVRPRGRAVHRVIRKALTRRDRVIQRGLLRDKPPVLPAIRAMTGNMRRNPQAMSTGPSVKRMAPRRSRGRRRARATRQSGGTVGRPEPEMPDQTGSKATLQTRTWEHAVKRPTRPRFPATRVTA